VVQPVIALAVAWACLHAAQVDNNARSFHERSRGHRCSGYSADHRCLVAWVRSRSVGRLLGETCGRWESVCSMPFLVAAALASRLRARPTVCTGSHIGVGSRSSQPRLDKCEMGRGLTVMPLGAGASTVSAPMTAVFWWVNQFSRMTCLTAYPWPTVAENLIQGDGYCPGCSALILLWRCGK